MRFRWVKAPTSDELTQLTHIIAQRIGHCLERQGLLVQDVDNSYLTAQAVDSARNMGSDPISPEYGVGSNFAVLGRWWAV